MASPDRITHQLVVLIDADRMAGDRIVEVLDQIEEEVRDFIEQEIAPELGEEIEVSRRITAPPPTLPLSERS